MPCSQNFFICIVFFTWACSTGLALKFHDYLDRVLFTNIDKYQTESEELEFLFTTPLNFQKQKANIYDFFATFCFIVVFVSLHQRQLHWRQFTFLKGEGMLFLLILFYFIIMFHFNFYTFKTSKKIIEKFCKSYSTND